MNEAEQLQILSAIREVYPHEFTERETKYLLWLIDNVDRIGGLDIARVICDYLKIDNKESRKKIRNKISSITSN